MYVEMDLQPQEVGAFDVMLSSKSFAMIHVIRHTFTMGVISQLLTFDFQTSCCLIDCLVPLQTVTNCMTMTAIVMQKTI